MAQMQQPTLVYLDSGTPHPTPNASGPPSPPVLPSPPPTNLSSYNTEQYHLNLNPGVGYSPQVAAHSVFSDRTAVEREEEAKLKNSTLGQLWFRGVTTFLAEFVSCFFFYLFLFVGGATGLNLLGASLLSAGLLLMICSVFVRENAGHLDPLVTLGLLITGKLGLPFYFSIFHFLGQACGALLSTLITWGLTPGFDRSLGLGYETVRPGYTPGQGFAAQLLGCFATYSIFIWLVCSAGQRNYYEQTGESYKRNTLFSLAVSFSHLASALAFGNICGPNFGWYLHFFPGVISGTLDSSNWWIYLVAPPIAMSFTLLIYFFYRWIENMAYQTSYKKGKIPKVKSN